MWMDSHGIGHLIQIWSVMVSTLIFWEPIPSPARSIMFLSEGLHTLLIRGANEVPSGIRQIRFLYVIPTRNPRTTAIVLPVGGQRHVKTLQGAPANNMRASTWCVIKD